MASKIDPSFARAWAQAAFFNLLMGMRLDRYPHAFIAVPALMRSFDPAVAVKDLGR